MHFKTPAALILVDGFPHEMVAFKALGYDNLRHGVKIQKPRGPEGQAELCLRFMISCYKYLCNGYAKQKGPDRHPAPCKIQYPMKNRREYSNVNVLLLMIFESFQELNFKVNYFL
jgi:hypothetical protein